MIIRWTGHIAAGTSSDRVTGFEDWLPTLLELSGAKRAVPADIDGISFARTVLGKTQPARPFLYREFPAYGGQQCVRIGDWKGVRQSLNPRPKSPDKANPTLHIELYNLKDDIAETKDVSAAHPVIIARMEKLMRQQHQPSKLFSIAALDKAR